MYFCNLVCLSPFLVSFPAPPTLNHTVYMVRVHLYFQQRSLIRIQKRAIMAPPSLFFVDPSCNMYFIFA